MKPHTNFRTVPVTGEGGRLPEKGGKYIVKRYNTDDLSECNYEPIDEFDKYWNRFIEFFLEEIPEQAEEVAFKSELKEVLGTNKPDKEKIYISPAHEKVFIYIDNEWKLFHANQPTPKPTDEDIERASRIYLMNIPMDGTPYTREDVDLAYQAGAKDCRDGKIVKPKE